MASATSVSLRSILGAPPSTASTSDSTLVIIDAQNEYADGKLRVEDVESSRKAIASLLEKYRAANAPIVHIVHATPEGAPIFTPKTQMSEIFKELTPKEGETVVAKQAIGGFSNTSLQDVLKQTGRSKVVFTGYMAHVCVSTTARQAADQGYDVIVPRDAVGDRHIPGVDAKQLTEVALHEIGDAFGTIVNSTEIN
ncbi:Secreted isochorismatase effector Isc1 [Paramyrothecium foliicola]|nr:Secreted isochorismatase effector Isc1 [Paramyrothecium foliicola]